MTIGLPGDRGGWGSALRCIALRGVMIGGRGCFAGCAERVGRYLSSCVWGVAIPASSGVLLEIVGGVGVDKRGAFPVCPPEALSMSPRSLLFIHGISVLPSRIQGYLSLMGGRLPPRLGRFFCMLLRGQYQGNMPDAKVTSTPFLAWWDRTEKWGLTARRCPRNDYTGLHIFTSLLRSPDVSSPIVC